MRVYICIDWSALLDGDEKEVGGRRMLLVECR